MGLLSGVGFIKPNYLVISVKVGFTNCAIHSKNSAFWRILVCWGTKISKFSANFWS